MSRMKRRERDWSCASKVVEVKEEEEVEAEAGEADPAGGLSRIHNNF